MFSTRILVVVMTSVIITITLITSHVAAQPSSPTSCATKLVICSQYLNATTTNPPPPSCCKPLREALTKELTCICSIFLDKELLTENGIDVTQAQNLPKNCGIVSDLGSVCKGEALSPESSANMPPPARAGDGDDDKNGACKIIAWTGVSSLLFLTTSLMLIAF